MPAMMREPPSSARGGRKPPGGRGKPRAQATYTPGKLGGFGFMGMERQTVINGVAILFVVAAGLILLSGGRAVGLARGIGGLADRTFAGLGFHVSVLKVEGGSSFSDPYIRRAAAIPQGQPILGLDLEKLRERVEAVGWVKSVKVRRLLPDTVLISVKERPRLAVWQHGRLTQVVDPQGQIIPEADPGLFSDLPLIVGEGANEAAGQIMPLVLARPRLLTRLEALVRVDARRWDLRLKDGSLIQLPARKEDSALIVLDQYDLKDRLLDLGFERIDLRTPDMVVVRPRLGPATVAAAPATPTSKI